MGNFSQVGLDKAFGALADPTRRAILARLERSKATKGSYDAANMAEDVDQLVTSLELPRVYIVGHDIGAMVTYAFVRRYPQATRGAMILDAPIPGVAGWDEGASGFWHIGFM